MNLKGRINVYQCSACSGLVTTIDIDEGVAPSVLRCRATKTKGCKAPMYSAFYPQGKPPSHVPAPAFEWFKPVDADYHKLSDAMKEHVDKGGLDIRPLTDLGRGLYRENYVSTPDAHLGATEGA